jgi:hypothetical protein
VYVAWSEAGSEGRVVADLSHIFPGAHPSPLGQFWDTDTWISKDKQVH